MTTFYYETKSKGKCGCSHYTWRKMNADSKKQIREIYRRRGTVVTVIYTEEQLKAKVTAEAFERITREAI